MATRDGSRRAVGCSVHTGWAVLVVIAGPPAEPSIVARHRIELADEKGRFVYHRAGEMALADAANFIDRATNEALSKAAAAFDALAAGAGKPSPLAAVGIIESNTVLPSSLEAILRSHASIHTAEGALYRRALHAAARRHELAAIGVPSKELHARAAAAIGVKAEALPAWLAELGRAAGRPWGRDEKDAVLVACVARAAR
jgi:hypothetical protein